MHGLDLIRQLLLAKTAHRQPHRIPTFRGMVNALD
jgi:hypothetical protein